MTAAQPRAGWSRPGWQELLLVGLITLGAFGLRAAHSERLSVEHFDEGVYASNWYCRPPGLPEGVFPQQHLYAPPLLPSLLEWMLILSGSQSQAVMWLNVIAGTCLVPVVWLAARDWFGPPTGISAALLAAGSDLHIALSRMALTDTLLCAFLVVAVWTACRALAEGGIGWIVLAGLMTALAWWTKYNGWLPLAIAATGVAGHFLFDRPAPFPVRGAVSALAGMAVIAAVVWSPVPLGLENHGGYAAVAENHARYVVGPTGWMSSAGRQFLNLQHLGSGVGWVMMLAGLCVSLAWASVRSNKDRWIVVALTGAGALFFGTTGGLLVAGAAVIGRRFREGPEARGLAFWIVVAWVGGLLVATPMYTPYPRLMAPLLTGLWLLAAGNAHRALVGTHPYAGVLPAVIVGVVLGGTVAISSGVALAWRDWTPRVAWQDQRGLEQVVPQLVDVVAEDLGERPVRGIEGVQAVLYVHAEPALFYHLSAAAEGADIGYLVQPSGEIRAVVEGKADARLATYVVTGPHTESMPEAREVISSALSTGRLELLGELTVQMSDFVLLDEVPPALLPERTNVIRLYRVR